MIGDLVKLWRDVPAKLDRLLEGVQHLQEAGVYISRHLLAPEPRQAVATLLIVAETMHDEQLVRTTLGSAATLREREESAWLYVVAQRPLRNVQVLVLCDLALVHVEGIMCGVNAATLGAAPIGYFRSVELGQQVGARVRLRS